MNSGELEKLVLAVKQSIVLERSFDPLLILYRLRHHQEASCRFLWSTDKDQYFFGASPERLMSINSGYVRSDALAGTSRKDDASIDLLRSKKNLREHELVVSSILEKFQSFGLIFPNISVVPPTGVPKTGKPLAKASTVARPNPSIAKVGKTNKSAAP